MKYLIPLVITVGLCWVMFRQIDYKEMMEVIRSQCDVRWIVIGLSITMLAHVFRGLRWRIQLLALGIEVPRSIVILSIFGTYAVNLVFPRLGEVWRTGYIAHRQDAPFATVFGSMVAERLSDTVVVGLITLATFIVASTSLVDYLRQNEEAYQSILSLLSSPWIWAAVVVCVIVAWRLLTYKSKSGSLLSRLQGFVKGLWQGFAVIFTMPGKGLWLLYTLFIWVSYFTSMYLTLYAFPFTAQMLAQYGIVSALVAYTLSSISMAVPSNGGIGPWQWAVIFALGMYGIGQTEAAAYANMVMGCQTLLLILLGIMTFVAIMLDKKRRK